MLKKIIILVLLLVPIQTVFAEDIIHITKASSLDDIVFDGKWSFVNEWKPTSLERVTQEDSQVPVYLRIAHQDEFIYVMINAVFDKHQNKGSDKATICFDSNNNKSKEFEENDFCFVSTLGRNSGTTHQGGSVSYMTNNFKNINNHREFLAVSNMSDENDRYSNVPHSVYEFRIPIEVLGRSDNYGFYMYVYDDHSKKIVSWPYQKDLKTFANIPEPQYWGNLVSPDKSLPEFPIPFLILIPALLVMIFLQNTNFIHKFDLK